MESGTLMKNTSEQLIIRGLQHNLHNITVELRNKFIVITGQAAPANFAFDASMPRGSGAMESPPPIPANSWGKSTNRCGLGELSPPYP
jgi:hypothetical protein